VSNLNLSERESVANTQFESLLDEHAVAKFYGVSVATVRRWRWLRTGPKFYKLGASVRYRLADLEAYLRGTPTGGEQSPQPEMCNVGHGSRPAGQR
jgi:predicted DNA-binding transcriptional regulator AlpA